jgi:hypothetical protein
MIHELKQTWSVTTPKGKAIVYLLMDYGFETDTLFLCVLKNTGEFFWFRSWECRMDDNCSIGRGDWNKIAEQIKSAAQP